MNKLEEIAKIYGMKDYMDMGTGNIYELSNAVDAGDGTLKVPVIAPYGDNLLLGYASMQKPE